MKRFVIGAIGVAALAGAATADINSINGLNFNAYENFQGNGPVIPSLLTLNGLPVPPVLNGSFFTALNPNAVREIYPTASGGFANRHILWASDNSGASAYQLQAGESFRVASCFRVTLPAGYPSGIGAPVTAETGLWIHNPRVGNDANGNPTVNFIDEGGVMLFTNGTSFSGGAGQDFALYGEGGFNNPASPPIFFPNDTVEIVYSYFANGYFAPNSLAQYEARVTNITRGISVSSGLKGFNADALGRVGLNPGTTIGFRVQNQVFPLIETDITTEFFNVSIIPGPGALALLGMGGLLASRRRR